MAIRKGTTTQPDIVFILVDNVGWGDFGVYGGTIPTPNRDPEWLHQTAASDYRNIKVGEDFNGYQKGATKVA